VELVYSRIWKLGDSQVDNKVGVMQGRLLPKYKKQYQAHPVGYWHEEFSIAASMGLGLIEFIVDLDGIEENPMMSESGILQINQTVTKTGVNVNSICADCFMAEPLHSTDPASANRSVGYLRRLINNAAHVGVAHIVIPCVDQSSLRTTDEIARFVDALNSVLGEAENMGVNLSLETDLDPVNFSRLLERFSSPRVTVNYDTGNSASLGYDPREELAAYGNRISDIHIKDRLKGGGSVLLGTGNADFSAFFDALSHIDYLGPFILQAYRDDQGVDIFRKQLNWIRPYIEACGQKTV
jgi:L-ribulose-5-phosphate 3-epimerase